jgi:hypothetical protein
VVNGLAVLRAYLAAQAPLTARTGTRLYVGNGLPSGYQVSQGDAVLINTRGGDEHYSGGVLNLSVQFRCYSASDLNAYTLAGVLYDVLHDKSTGQIAKARQDVHPYILKDDTLNIPFALSFWTVRVRNP